MSIPLWGGEIGRLGDWRLEIGGLVDWVIGSLGDFLIHRMSVCQVSVWQTTFAFCLLHPPGIEFESLADVILPGSGRQQMPAPSML